MKILIVFSSLIASILAQSPYCKLCLNSSKVSNHIICLNPTGAWSSACPVTKSLVPLDAALILKEHNNWRNELANGRIGGFKPATNMMKLTYSDEMAKIAEYNVKQCQMKHDKCRNLLDGSYSGQNLFAASWTGNAKANATTGVTSAVGAWFSEYKNANQTVLDKFGNWTGKVIGHFTQVAWATNTKVGCAASTYVSNGWTSLLIACNYGPGNMVGSSVYKAGVVGSACKARDTTYKGLCTA